MRDLFLCFIYLSQGAGGGRGTAASPYALQDSAPTQTQEKSVGINSHESGLTPLSRLTNSGEM
ncbi:MAG: hypothetical protein FWH20_02600 [Oscillospiraceae bacterium]|nr:hypothetical protein [Oscillospiraceae bacterium]